MSGRVATLERVARSMKIRSHWPGLKDCDVWARGRHRYCNISASVQTQHYQERMDSTFWISFVQHSESFRLLGHGHGYLTSLLKEFWGGSSISLFHLVSNSGRGSPTTGARPIVTNRQTQDKHHSISHQCKHYIIDNDDVYVFPLFIPHDLIAASRKSWLTS